MGNQKSLSPKIDQPLVFQLAEYSMLLMIVAMMVVSLKEKA